MRHDEQVRVIKELLAKLDAGITVDAGGLRRNPASAYTDPELAARERQVFFREHPQMVGFSGDLPEPGSFLTIDDLEVPILATRDSDGAFRAFVNACRHRGVPVESRERGTAKRFACPFHGWNYDTGGALVGLPKAHHFGDVDKACLGLVELPAVERYGLLYVHQDPSASIAVEALLGADLGAELATWAGRRSRTHGVLAHSSGGWRNGRSHAEAPASSSWPAAIANTVASASSMLGCSRHVHPFVATNIRIDTHAARLLPSGSGWFLFSRTSNTAALSTKSGYMSTSPNPAAGAWSAESAPDRRVTFARVMRSRPVISAAMAR